MIKYRLLSAWYWFTEKLGFTPVLLSDPHIKLEPLSDEDLNDF